MCGETAHNENMSHVVKGIAPEKACCTVVDVAQPIEAYAGERSVDVRVRNNLRWEDVGVGRPVERERVLFFDVFEDRGPRRNPGECGAEDGEVAFQRNML